MDEKQLIKEQFCIKSMHCKRKVQYMYDQMSPYLSTFFAFTIIQFKCLIGILFIHFNTFVSQIGSNWSCCCCNCALDIVARQFCSCKDSLYRSFN